jgi:hypothetical protein
LLSRPQYPTSRAATPCCALFTGHYSPRLRSLSRRPAPKRSRAYARPWRGRLRCCSAFCGTLGTANLRRYCVRVFCASGLPCVISTRWLSTAGRPLDVWRVAFADSRRAPWSSSRLYLLSPCFPCQSLRLTLCPFDPLTYRLLLGPCRSHGGGYDRWHVSYPRTWLWLLGLSRFAAVRLPWTALPFGVTPYVLGGPRHLSTPMLMDVVMPVLALPIAVYHLPASATPRSRPEFPAARTRVRFRCLRLMRLLAAWRGLRRARRCRLKGIWCTQLLLVLRRPLVTSFTDAKPPFSARFPPLFFYALEGSPIRHVW